MNTKYQNMLKEHQLKVTSNRLMMLKAIDENESFLSAEDLYKTLAKKNKTISLSTVYRAMDALVAAGIIAPVNLETSKETLYEFAHSEHAHHLICLSCKKVIHIHSCPVHSFEASIAKDYQFDIKEHKLELYGYCSECKT